MANREHEALLREGTEAITLWTMQNPGACLELDHADLRGAKLAHVMLLNADLRKAELADADLSGAGFMNTDLTGAELFRANLSEAELNGVQMAGADLRWANLEGADLRGACLASANLKRANLTGADLTGADLTDADLESAVLVLAKLRRTVLVGTRLVACNLDRAYVEGVVYDRHRWSCAGINVATCYGDPFFKRDAEDQDWLDHYEERHPHLFVLWMLTSDCGRSLGRVVAVSLGMALLFGMIYAQTLYPLITVRTTEDTWFAPFYYSVVTFTTLGFGDITPANVVGQMVVVVQVILGYLGLGMLVSILATKVARRS